MFGIRHRIYATQLIARLDPIAIAIVTPIAALEHVQSRAPDASANAIAFEIIMIQEVPVSEDANVVAYSFLLVLCDAFRDPSNIPYLLMTVSAVVASMLVEGGEPTCSLSFTQA